MANTIVNNASLLNQVQVQEKLISVMAERQSPFANMIGTSMDSIIQRLTDLEKGKGDSIRFHIGAKLTGEGINGDELLEGEEEAMRHFHDSILIDQKSHAIRLDGQMTEQRSAIALSKEAGPRLGIWAREWMVELISAYMYGARGVRTGQLLPTSFTGFATNPLQAPDADHYMVAGAGTKEGLTANDKMNCELLDKAVRRIKLLINSGAAMRPATAKNGRKYFLCMVTPEQAYDLRRDSEFREVQKFAASRGEDNVMFTGQLGVYNGLVLVENDVGALFADYGVGTDVPAARAVILGSQALGIAHGGVGGTKEGEGRWRYVTKSDFNYHSQTGFAVRTIVGVKKLRFDGKDYGTFTLDTAYSV
jgi:N4-gp56 family major capsid protein